MNKIKFSYFIDKIVNIPIKIIKNILTYLFFIYSAFIANLIYIKFICCLILSCK